MPTLFFSTWRAWTFINLFFSLLSIFFDFVYMSVQFQKSDWKGLFHYLVQIAERVDWEMLKSWNPLLHSTWMYSRAMWVWLIHYYYLVNSINLLLQIKKYVGLFLVKEISIRVCFFIIILYILLFQVVMDNGLVRVTLSNPAGIVTEIKYEGVDNALDYSQRESRRGYIFTFIQLFFLV